MKIKNVHSSTAKADPAVDNFLTSYTCRRILRVIEEDVDGCGSNADMFVLFSGIVDDVIKDRFQKILRGVKARVSSDDFDTESMVMDAVEQFNASVFASNRGITVGIVKAPYCGDVTF